MEDVDLAAALGGVPELAVALEAAAAAGDVIRHYYRHGVEMREKSHANLVSDADLQAEQAIARIVLKAFPTHGILGEEECTADAASEHLWIVDPLDGTNNFGHKLPQFATSVGYYRGGKPYCGVVHHPIRGEWYAAVLGRGAFAAGVPGHSDAPLLPGNLQPFYAAAPSWEAWRRASVSAEPKLENAMIGLGFYYDRGERMRATLSTIDDLFRHGIHGVRRFGAASLDLCLVGVGRLEGFFEFQLSPWDVAAGGLFITEAGGVFTDCLGNPFGIAPGSVLTGSPAIHSQMLPLVSARYRPVQDKI